MKNGTLTLVFLLSVCFGFAQDMERQLDYEIRKRFTRPITQEQLFAAKTINDVNPGFPSSWIEKYETVEVSAISDGALRKAVGKKVKLNKEQMSLLKSADLGTEIKVHVKYYSMKHHTKEAVKEINFAYVVGLKSDATFLGGDEVLRKYLQENMVDKIPESVKEKLELAKVKFIINKNGKVENAEVTVSSGDDAVDKLLLEAINKMDQWQPAKNTNGDTLNQEFELFVGLHVMNGNGC